MKKINLESFVYLKIKKKYKSPLEFNTLKFNTDKHNKILTPSNNLIYQVRHLNEVNIKNKL